jgi:ribosome maturation factor RimP
MSGRGLAPTFFVEGDVRRMDAETLVRPVIEGAGLELVDVSFRREHGRRVLRVVVDREDGVDVDTIAEIAERVSRRLDLEGFAPGPYELEVSSPGIERPLRRPDEFRRHLGRTVKVKTVRPVDGRASFTGELITADDDGIVIGAGDDRVRVSHDDIASARTIADWDAELKGSTR